MMRIEKSLLLYAVTPTYDPSDTSFLKRVEGALAGGITCLQIREKDEALIKTDSYISLLGTISKRARSYDVPLIINDWVDLAKEVGAAGVHLGQDDGSCLMARRLLGDNAIIGISAHDLGEALHAQEEGADYLGVGALFPTSTKLDATFVSMECLRTITSKVDLPVVGIGGITADNMAELSSSGIKGIAVVSALFSHVDTQKQARTLRSKAETLFG